MVLKKNIQTTKTGRYFLNGIVNEKTERIIIACHGYGELAESFIKNFDALDKEKFLVIAPEGLHRFYVKGFYGSVGASWMTKEDRQSEIDDYVKFLDKIYSEEIEIPANNNVTKTAFGFSQGTATICRWFINGISKIDELILWGGGVPNDIDLEKYREKFNSIRFKIFIGDNDPFITAEQIDNERKKLNEYGINHEMIIYNGVHKIEKEILKAII